MTISYFTGAQKINATQLNMLYGTKKKKKITRSEIHGGSPRLFLLVHVNADNGTHLRT